ncbi:catalase, partial [Mycobacterium avium]|uniref:catalase n=1 Tax=Mycobacterium avium TaxID=1764 RepID=UPI001E41E85C
GPVLLQDFYLIEQLDAFNRERVPERQPHAKGTGAFGRFEVPNDLSAYTKAAVFQPGTKTDVFVRLSGNAGERGSADSGESVQKSHCMLWSRQSLFARRLA